MINIDEIDLNRLMTMDEYREIVMPLRRVTVNTFTLQPRVYGNRHHRRRAVAKRCVRYFS